jgi:N-acetylmuramoyl-L-alanine amidase
MASATVLRRRALVAAFILIPTAAWAMGKVGTGSSGAPAARATRSPSSSPSPSAPPGSSQLSARGVSFAPGACIAFPPKEGAAKATVFVDAGHGGVDPGGAGRTSGGRRIPEKSATLAVAKAATEQLRAAGYRVVVSRWTDTAVEIAKPGYVVGGIFTPEGARHDTLARVACANASGAKLLVSVHMNAFASPLEGGALTIYDPDRTFSAANKRLATLLQRSVIASLHRQGWPVPDRSILKDTQNHGTALTAAGARYGHEALLGPYARGWVPNPTRMPGAIIEPLFLTRPTEADIVASPAGQAVLAKAILIAVQQFLGP